MEFAVKALNLEAMDEAKRKALDEVFGKIEKGFDADLLVLDYDANVKKVFIKNI